VGNQRVMQNNKANRMINNYFIKNVAKALPHILYLFDLRSKKNIYTNNAVETLLGYSIAEIKMSYNSIYDLIHPEDLDSVRKYVTRVATTYTDDIFETEFRILNKEKKYIWLRNISKVFKRDENKYTGTLIVGIATMHKSNSVPVINQNQAEEIARMRR
jgi:PAS domain S-box-containing protein